MKVVGWNQQQVISQDVTVEITSLTIVEGKWL